MKSLTSTTVYCYWHFVCFYVNVHFMSTCFPFAFVCTQDSQLPLFFLLPPFTLSIPRSLLPLLSLLPLPPLSSFPPPPPSSPHPSYPLLLSLPPSFLCFPYLPPIFPPSFPPPFLLCPLLLTPSPLPPTFLPPPSILSPSSLSSLCSKCLRYKDSKSRGESSCRAR